MFLGTVSQFLGSPVVLLDVAVVSEVEQVWKCPALHTHLHLRNAPLVTMYVAV